MGKGADAPDRIPFWYRVQVKVDLPSGKKVVRTHNGTCFVENEDAVKERVHTLYASVGEIVRLQVSNKAIGDAPVTPAATPQAYTPNRLAHQPGIAPVPINNPSKKWEYCVHLNMGDGRVQESSGVIEAYTEAQARALVMRKLNTGGKVVMGFTVKLLTPALPAAISPQPRVTTPYVAPATKVAQALFIEPNHFQEVDFVRYTIQPVSRTLNGEAQSA